MSLRSNEDTCGGTCTADVTAVEVDNGVRTDSGTGLNEDTCGGTCTAKTTAVRSVTKAEEEYTLVPKST